MHVRLDRVPDLAARPSAELIRSVAAGLRRPGSPRGRRGPGRASGQLSAPGVRTPWWQRPFVRAPHVRVHDLRAALRTLPRRGGRPGADRDRTAGDAVHAAIDRAATGSDRAPPAAHLDHPRPGRRRGSAALLPGRGQRRRPVEGVLPPAGGSASATGRTLTCGCAGWPLIRRSSVGTPRTSTSSSPTPTDCPSGCTAHGCCGATQLRTGARIEIGTWTDGLLPGRARRPRASVRRAVRAARSTSSSGSRPAATARRSARDRPGGSGG